MKHSFHLPILTVTFLTPIMVRAEPIPEKYRPTVDKGLAWLAKQQRADGSWVVKDHQYPTAITSLAGLALLMEGSGPDQGKYAPSLGKARNYLLRQVCKDGPHVGLIADLHNPTESPRYIFGHGYAMLFLSSVLAVEENPAERKRLIQALAGAAEFSARAQSARGGWFYNSNQDGQDNDEGATSLVQLHGLRAARNVGVPVNKKMLHKAKDYLAKLTQDSGGVGYSFQSKNERPGLTAAALTCAWGMDDFESPLAKRWWQYCLANLTVPPGNLTDDFTAFHFALAVHALKDDGYRRLFPKGEKPLQWTSFRAMYFDHLQRTQGEDGSWKSLGGFSVGPVYTSALNLIVLQLDQQYVPLFTNR